MNNSENEQEEHRYPYEPKRGTTHWKDCWKAPGHHNCAVARVYRLQRRLKEVEERKSEFKSALNVTRDQRDATRRRADRLGEAVREVVDKLVGHGDIAGAEVPNGNCVKCEIRNDLRSALDSREDKGDDCTCPRHDNQHGWDPICPRHGSDRSEWCDYEDHVPGRQDYGFTDRGGRKRLCAKCEAPLEIHEDDSGKYTEGWHGEKTDQRPVHADEPEGEECKCKYGVRAVFTSDCPVHFDDGE